MPATESLAARVQRLREQMGWTRSELAERAGLHPSHIGLIERSGRVGVRPETLARMAAAFGIPVARLLGDTETESTTDLEPYRQAIEVARSYGIGPDDLVKLITTAAGLFVNK